ncbi:uncharacterized protein LOC141672499 [Apium graveolens]|uniref:uncharacterized protein LOC141672499 n=1 Tax=Apium graveolens TaxID=4045 RepID=UPI003D78E721
MSNPRLSEELESTAESHPMATTVSNRPESSGTIPPRQSVPSTLASLPKYDVIDVFIQGLKEIQGEVSKEEYSWAKLHLSKYKGRILLFSSYDKANRIRLLKEGNAEHKQKRRMLVESAKQRQKRKQ